MSNVDAEKRQMLIDVYTRCLLFGIDRARYENFAYYYKDNKLSISRVYHKATTDKIIIPGEFDVFNATLARKNLEFLDLGNVSYASIKLELLPKLHTLIARKITKPNYSFQFMFKKGRLKNLNMDSLEVVSLSMLKDLQHSLEETSFKSVTTIQQHSFYHFYNLRSIRLSNKLKIVGINAFDRCESLEDIYFFGTEAEFNNISVGKGNECFMNARVNYLI